MKAMGKNRAEIAWATGMSTGWVSKHTADVSKPDIKVQAIQMNAEGKSLREIAKVTGKAHETIRRWLDSGV